MSVTDPLIKDIKAWALKLFEESLTQKITDSSENLENFCRVLEQIFYKGLIQTQGIFYGNKKKEPYYWMASLSSTSTDLANFNFKNSVEQVQSCKNVDTYLGKFRLLIRHCLMKKCLHFPLQTLNESIKTKPLYERNSIIGDDILSAIFLSVLLQCNKLNFELQLCNSYFLDLTWQIPTVVKLELVPCNNLGIVVSFSENKAVIVSIIPNSVASEYREISIGDVLVNLNGIDIISSCKGRLNAILSLSKGRPVNIVLVKASETFAPLTKILKNLEIDAISFKHSEADSSDAKPSGVSIAPNTNARYKGTYVGSVNGCNKGNAKQIEEAIKSCTKHLKRPIMFEIGEMGIKVTDLNTNETVFNHPYVHISSCGSAAGISNYIAYAVKEEKCESFVCHVFYVKHVEDAYTILQSIGQGFSRTHFAV